MNTPTNILFALLTVLFFNACSSLQVTEEAVADQSVAGVSLTSKSTAVQAVLANAVVLRFFVVLLTSLLSKMKQLQR